MSSTFVNMSKHNTSLFGEKNIDVFLQFVPGIVLEVATSMESAICKSTRHINSIIAHPHISNDNVINKKSLSKVRYYPLLRGQVDVPIKGDPVLLCTFGGVNYYIGPINTINNPNFNVDHLNLKTPLVEDSKISINNNISKDGSSLNFTKLPVKRLEKNYKENLDNVQKNKNVYRDIAGDMLFEGRYGNNIRIGSRDYKPVLIFQNGRNPLASVEQLDNTSTFFMSEYGTIREHFSSDFIDKTGESANKGLKDRSGPAIEIEPLKFELSSNTIEYLDENKKRTRIISDDDYNYDYNMQQILINSDKLTLNSKKQSMFLSSLKDIYIGTGENLNIFTEKETVIESSNIYLGKQAKDKNDLQDADNPAQPIVLGEELRLFLIKILDVVSSIRVTGVQPGISGPPEPGVISDIQGLQNELKNSQVTPFNSNYHYVEDNGNKEEREQEDNN